MNERELFVLLQTLSIPIAYRAFDEKAKAKPPFAVYYREDNEHDHADDTIYHTRKNMVLELYTPKARNLAVEQEIESLLLKNEIIFEVDETYLASLGCSSR